MDYIYYDIENEIRNENVFHHVLLSFRCEDMFFRNLSNDKVYLEYEEELANQHSESALLK